MGCCWSSPNPPPNSSSPRTGGVPLQPQPHVQASEPLQGVTPVPQGRDATPEPAKPVQSGEPIPTPTPSQSDENTSQKFRSGRQNLPSPPQRSTSAYPSFDNARMGPLIVEGQSHKSGGSRLPSYRHKMNRSYSETPYGPPLVPTGAPSSRDERVRGYKQQNGVELTSDPRFATRATLKQAVARGNNTRFPSTVREVLPDGFRFRILVLGKSRSGKSSLINAIFNMTAATGSQHGNADINVGFSPGDNRYLIVHEHSGFESGDAQSLQTIRNFISYRTDADRSASERLHAIWICVPISDAIEGGLGDGVKAILGMKKVPVLIVFTKFDLLVSRVQFEITRGDIQTHEHPGVRAHAMYENLCGSLFHRDPKDVPAVIFSEKPAYRYLIGELTSTTHAIIKADSHHFAGGPTSSQVQRPPITPALLAWSIAQMVSHDIIIQASIEHVLSSSFPKTITSSRSSGLGEVVRYWRSLGSSKDFTDQTLASCVNVIHEDIISVWNFGDGERYLSSTDFMARMSHLVGDLAGPPAISPVLDSNGTATTPMAQWVNGPYQNKNIRCIMAYIVDLTVILHGLFVLTRSVSAKKVQSAVKNYAGSSRSLIHDEIRNFITEIPSAYQTYQKKDTIMEKIIDLIKQNCVPTPS
ncbi:hypothetical protein EDB85DRAFT_2294479 [Lactarius pseudohatsudake]|nr:hypothetical protein EDB85DRAFT_2294479 [Lactarius pseudohatsudake]